MEVIIRQTNTLENLSLQEHLRHMWRELRVNGIGTLITSLLRLRETDWYITKSN